MNVYFDTEDSSKTDFVRNMDDKAEISQVKKKRKVTLICAIAEDGSKFVTRKGGEVFLNWLAELSMKAEELKVYAFNLSYDIGNVFWEKLDAGEPLFIDGRLLSFQWAPNIEFRDARNLYPTASIARLGDMLGKQKLEFGEDDETYCFRDVEILKESVERLKRYSFAKGVRTLPNTLARLGREMYLAAGGYLEHHTSHLAREALYGGRTELFADRIPREKGSRYNDLNSLYPFIMATRELPMNLQIWDTLELRPNGISRVVVKVPEQEICPLPVKTVFGNAFPFGTFEGVWCNPEIHHAVEHHGVQVLSIKSQLSSDEALPVFASYMQQMYEERVNTKTSLEREMVKLLMNSLYGQMATTGEGLERGVLWLGEEHLAWQDKMREEDDCGMLVKYGNRVLLPLNEGVPTYANWSWGAYITAYARIELLKYLKIAIKSGRLCYCDTDSVILSGPEPLFEEGTGLGQMKAERVIPPENMKEDSIFVQRKTYMQAFGPQTEQEKKQLEILHRDYFVEAKAKGVPRKEAENFLRTGKAKFAKPFRFKEAIQSYDSGNEKPLSLWYEMVKELRGGMWGNNFYRKVKRYQPPTREGGVGRWQPLSYDVLTIDRTAESL